MKKFVGYFILGARDKNEAKDEKGLLIWSQFRPRWFKRLMLNILLGIYWIDKIKSVDKKERNTELKK